MTDFDGPTARRCPSPAETVVLLTCPQQHVGCLTVCAEHLAGARGGGCLDCYVQGVDSDLSVIEVPAA
jgi:hypothetical protein